jgi:hypothetical protein
MCMMGVLSITLSSTSMWSMLLTLCSLAVGGGANIQAFLSYSIQKRRLPLDVVLAGVEQLRSLPINTHKC